LRLPLTFMTEPFQNLKQLAAHLGLSPATVSRVLNGKGEAGRISEETRRRVMEAVEQRGLIRNAMARGLKMARTQTLGLMVPDIRNPYFSAVAQSIMKHARESHYSVLLCDNEEDESIEKQQLALLVDRQVDGIIAAPVGQDGRHWTQLQSRGLALCLVDRYFAGRDLPYVSSDNRLGGLIATSYLLEMGHRRLAILQGNPKTTVNAERLRGVRDVLVQHGMSLADVVVMGDDFGEESGYTHAMRLFAETKPRPSAIFAFSNMIAVGVMRAAAENKIRMPEDLSLIAFDELSTSRFLNPPLTTIAQDVERIGAESVALLLRRIGGQIIPLETRLPIHLIERSSVAINPFSGQR
jgi:LacI family transcriptional regulator